MAKKKAIVKRASEQTADIPTRRARGRVRAGKALFPVPASATSMPPDYAEVLAKLKLRIAGAQTRASLSINRELVALYWHVGATIAHRQTQSDWGDSVVERLAFDVRKAFPGIEGFSPRNIWRMRAFFFAWSEGKLTQAVSEKPLSARAAVKLPQAVSEIPWGHNILIMQQLENYEERLWYAEQTRANGWSRAVLQAQLASNAHGRQGKATTNFVRALAKRQSAIAEQTLKDPYIFDFLTVGQNAHERVAERDLIAHVREFLLELGAGFAFIGNQVKLTVGASDYFLDLLFYHVRLRCYVVVELKSVAFRPEHVGKLNFYLSAVDDLLRHPSDEPTIGLLLCRSRDRVQVEYALRDLHKPIGVARWKTTLLEHLPDTLKGSLPTVAELEAELIPKKKTRRTRAKSQ